MSTDALHRDLVTAYTRMLQRRARRRRRVQGTALAAAVLLALSGTALGTARLLGWPAPEHVKQELAGVDRGLPADLRLNPDVEYARAVASTGGATLYAADLKDGGSCTEIVTGSGRGRGATCTTAAQLASRPLDVALPFDDGASPDAPVVLGGRLNDAAATSLEIVYADGSTALIPLGDRRYFLFDVPAAMRTSVHGAGFELVARSASGRIVTRSTVPADWDDVAVPDEESPLVVSTRSDESDFTKVYGLEGHVAAEGASTLELVYADGTRVAIPLRADGSYEYAVPDDRIDDFMHPARLLASNSAGEVVASAPVAAVAYRRGRERAGRP